MEQSSLERTIHRIPASRSNVASNKTRLHGRQRVAAYCRVSTDSEEQINIKSKTFSKNYTILFAKLLVTVRQPALKRAKLWDKMSQGRDQQLYDTASESE